MSIFSLSLSLSLRTLLDAGNMYLVGTIDVSELRAVSGLRNQNSGLVILFENTAEGMAKKFLPQLNLR